MTISTTKIPALVSALHLVPGVCRVRQSRGKIVAFDLVAVDDDVTTVGQPGYQLDLETETGELTELPRDGVTRETYDHHAKANTIGQVRAAIAAVLAPTGPEKKYGLYCLQSGRWVPMRGAGTWAEWRADAPSDVETVRVTEQRDGLTVVVWEGHPDEMPNEAPEPKAAPSVETIGMLEANPLITTGELDAIRDEANRVADGLGVQGHTPINSAVQNPAAYARTVCVSDRRDPCGDFVAIYTFHPTITARTVATVREWLAASAEERAQLIASAVGYLFNGGVQP